MDKQYYKIGEVSKLLNIKTSTLRFWESEFRQLNPVKTATNQRYYTEKHIDFLKSLKSMLYDEKYTIEGAKKRLCTNSVPVEKINHIENPPIDRDYIKKELIEILELLK